MKDSTVYSILGRNPEDSPAGLVRDLFFGY